jgi:hypothetical protein
MHLFWHLFGDAGPVGQVLGLLQLAFTIWMLVDAYQRGVEGFWYWIILLFQPIGAWGYFFAIKLRTLRLGRLRSAGTGTWERKLPLDELRHRVERAPTVANRLALAERLMEKGAHAEAIPHLEAILAIEPEYGAALHALARCRLVTGAAEEAVAPLEKLLRHDRRWGNYRAWSTLIEVHQARGQPVAALTACRELEKYQPTLENKCQLAEHLLDNARPAEAVQLLDQALSDYQYTPWGVRMRNWRWAREARRLLGEAENGERSAAEQHEGRA